MNFYTDIFTQFDKDWALLSAGTIDDHNAMTVSWGGMGTLWGKPVVTVYVRHSRHTFSYMEKNDCFALSFYDASYKKALGVMGSLSGRDCDKDEKAELHPIAIENSVSYKEAKTTIICKKIYCDDIRMEDMSEHIVRSYYPTEDIHRMYIGEVVDIIEE